MKRIFRTKKGKNDDKFTLVSNDLLNSELSADSIYVMVQVLKKHDHWKFYINKFSVEIKFGERRLRTALKELEEKGYCVRNKISKREVEYKFFESKFINPNQFELVGKDDIEKSQNETLSISNCITEIDDLPF